MLDDVVKESLTFDDLLLVPAASDVLPRDVDTATHSVSYTHLTLPTIYSV